MGRITIFTFSHDAASEEVLQLFQHLGVVPATIDLWDHPTYREPMVRLSGLKTPPVVFFNDTPIGGRDTVLALHAGGHLEQMLQTFASVAPLVPEGLEVAPPAEKKSADGKKPKAPERRDSGTEKAPMPPLHDRDAYYGKLMGMAKHSQVGVPVADRMLNLKFCRTCFVGSEFVDWIIRNLDATLTREQAVAKGQAMMDAGVFNHVEHTFPFLDTYVFYRFLEDEPHLVLNAAASHPGTQRTASEVAHDVCVNMHATCRRFTDSSGVDFSGLAVSPEWSALTDLTLELQAVDLGLLDRWGRLSLYINLYHALAMHAHVAVGAPKSSLAVMGLTNTIDYAIGGYTYTLNDIHHGLLRGNKTPSGGMKRPFGIGDPRLAFIVDPPDTRAHFVLNFGGKTGPRLKAYSPANIDAELQVATEEFLEEVQVIVQRDEVHLPALFKWYRRDFGNTEREVLEWVKPFLFRDKQAQLQQILDRNHWTIVYDSGPSKLPPKPAPKAAAPMMGTTKTLDEALAEVKHELSQRAQRPGSFSNQYYRAADSAFPFVPPPPNYGQPSPPPAPPPKPPADPLWRGMFGPEVPLPPMPKLPPLPPLPGRAGQLQPATWDNFRALPITMGFLISTKLCFQEADPGYQGFVPTSTLQQWSAADNDGGLAAKLVDQADVHKTGRINFWSFLGIQVYMALGMYGHADMRDWILFLNQCYEPDYDSTFVFHSPESAKNLRRPRVV
eukprot:EG_transcript_3273